MATVPFSEAQVLEMLRQENPEAFKRVYRDYFGLVWNHVKLNNGKSADAEDLFQETLVALVKNIRRPDFQLTSKLGTYLLGIAKNLWMQHLEKGRRQIQLKTELATEGEKTEPTEPPEQEKLIELIGAKMDELNADCSKLLHLFYYEKRSQAEIAEVFNYTEAFAKQKKFRCLEALRKSVRHAAEQLFS